MSSGAFLHPSFIQQHALLLTCSKLARERSLEKTKDERQRRWMGRVVQAGARMLQEKLGGVMVVGGQGRE